MSKLSNINLHISKYIKPLIVMTLVFLFIKDWYLYLFVILFFLIYVALSKGHFMINYNRFSFHSLFKKVSLETPITYTSWWSYEFKRPYWATEMGKPKMKSRENIVHVYS